MRYIANIPIINPHTHATLSLKNALEGELREGSAIWELEEHPSPLSPA